MSESISRHLRVVFVESNKTGKSPLGCLTQRIRKVVQRLRFLISQIPRTATLFGGYRMAILETVFLVVGLGGSVSMTTEIMLHEVTSLSVLTQGWGLLLGLKF